MRTPFIAGNWKMNKTAEEAAAFANEIKDELNAIFFVYIDKLINSHRIKVCNTFR